MNSRVWHRWIRIALFALGASLVMPAQVNKAAMRTTGLSCGFCAGLSELDFKRMDGVDKVNLSLSKEIVVITYKPGARFDPERIRKILEPWMVTVVQFQIDARGRAEQRGNKKVFVAGNETFALAASGKEIPLNTLVNIEGIVNDGVNPKELRILDLKPNGSGGNVSKQ